MTVVDWVLVAWLMLGMFMVVATIGKEKKPIEPSVAAFIIGLDLLLVGALLWSHGVLG